MENRGITLGRYGPKLESANNFQYRQLILTNSIKILRVISDMKSYKRLADISEELIVLMMEAESASETSVNICQTTRCNNPKDSYLLQTTDDDDDDDQWRYSPDRALASLAGFMIVCSSTWGYQLHDRPVQHTLIQPSQPSSCNY
jgi:hypothetical protein